MTTDESPDSIRVLNSILRILVESYEQTAAHSSLMIRDSDLRAGEKYFTSLNPESRNDPFYLELIWGTVLAIGLQAAIDGIPPGWLSDVQRFFAALGGLALALGFLSLRWWFIWRTRGIYQTILSRTFQDVSDAYSIHSALNVRLQRDKQLRVALEAILLPLSGKSWEEISRAHYLPEVRDNIDRIAEIDRQRMLDLNEYERKGGDYWLELLQATLRSELPGFVCAYITSARKSNDVKQRSQNLKKWRVDAIRLCDALYKVDKRFAGNKPAYQQLLERLDEVEDFSRTGLNRLLTACAAEPFNYTGPRARLPNKFFFQRDFTTPSPNMQSLAM